WDHSVLLSSVGDGGPGGVLTNEGSMPLKAAPAIRARGFCPSREATAAELITRAAAPSLAPGAFPAVTVPFSSNAGLSSPRVSVVVSALGRSSLEISATGSPGFLATAAGTISAWK